MTASQSTISAYFQHTTSPRKSGKRVSSPIDLTLDGEDAGRKAPSKRPRLAGCDTTPFAHDGPSSSKNMSTTVADDWRYSPEKPKQAGPSKPRTGLEKERHEAFKRKLLQDNSSFLKKELNIIEDDRDQAIGVDEGEGSAEDSGNESDRFQRLSEMFSHRDKGKGKAKTKSTAQTRKVTEVGPSGQSYTPLEKQILQLKKENVGTVLMVEVGYKYKFFGDDAKIADRELGMVAYMDRNFLVASIPVHRRDVHLKKLLSGGYRVGIVNQIETAALKKISDNRNAPFDRKLAHLYTAATYVEELDSVDDLEKYTAPPFMCIIEEKKGNSSSDVSIGMITICPSTGDVVWDDFDDTIMRLELETRLVHTRPAELLVSKNDLTPATGKMLSHFTGISSSGHHIRTETFKTVMSYTDAFSKVSEFYTDKKKFGAASESFKSGKLMAIITDFPKRVIVALAHAIKYLSAFGIADAFLETNFFTKFTTRAHMLLAANTLINLEIYRNEDDNTTRGSLMWILDRTKTKFGARLLRSWVGRPLVDKRVLQDRVDAVQEILESSSETLLTLRGVLKGLPDLAKGLCRIQYGQCTPKELSVLLPAFNKVAVAFAHADGPESVGLKSSVLNGIISSLPKLKDPMSELLKAVDLKKAADGKKDSIWTDWDRYPEISDADMSLQVIHMELTEELKAIRKLLRMPSLQWTTVAIDDHLIEVKRSDKRAIPENWILHSKTKIYARYQPPSVRLKLEERAQRRETLAAEAEKAYRSFLAEITEKYYGVLRDAVNKLATADCLLSLAQVALQENYVRPEFTEDDTLEIVDGRHPMIEAYSENPYISNSIQMGGGEARNKIITGPNMGGKSSCVRMIALISLMAQIGSYVPATSVKMGLLDSILTRMGASDDLARGRSTFMVEMSETSEILQTATNRSLVILDELGRGTSTFDGMAIADATLQYLVDKVKCKTLFITHYPLLATRLQSKFPKDVQNLHMGYEAESRINGTRSITFLYHLISGLATESFGIECGRLAKLPEEVLSVAAERSMHMQEEVRQRARRNR
ncbi:DNA mismatch repair protein MSH3 [Flammula alnicola]|nr:DNA mismatch repair protein MSH3 [Flammula alnicola]